MVLRGPCKSAFREARLESRRYTGPPRATYSRTPPKCTGASEVEMTAFTREPGFGCVVNLSGQAVALPAHRELLLASGPLDGGRLPPDSAAWLARP